MNVSRLRSSIPKLVVLGTTLLFLWSMTTSPAWAKAGTFTELVGNNIGRIAAK
jgi:hypothetical protein